MAWLGHMFRGLRQTGGKKPHQFCKVGSTETCPMSSMSRGKPTGVKPGGQTACIDSRARYVFEVIPGDTDKLLIFFQGGGACWDEWSTTTKMPLGGKRGFCSQRPLLGTFNHELTQTVFRGYTVVHVNYCSGDAHVGSVTRPWRIKGVPVKQHGYHNARAAIDWAKANVAARLSSLALMGCSAGALGVGAWAHRLLGEFSYERASVVADSYIGIFPAGAAARVVKSFGTCDLGLLAEPLASRCQQGNSTLTYPDMLETAMRDFPGVGFANINSKQDRVQILFYNMVACSFREVSFLNMISYSRTYYTRLNRILERYSGYPNYVSFLVNGVTHCFTCTPLTRKFRVNFRVTAGLHMESHSTLLQAAYPVVVAPVPLAVPMVRRPAADVEVMRPANRDASVASLDGDEVEYSEPRDDLPGLLEYFEMLAQRGVRLTEVTYVVNKWSLGGVIPLWHHGFILQAGDEGFVTLDFSRRGILWDTFDSYPDLPENTVFVKKYGVSTDPRVMKQYCEETKPFSWHSNDCQQWAQGAMRAMRVKEDPLKDRASFRSAQTSDFFACGSNILERRAVPTCMQ